MTSINAAIQSWEPLAPMEASALGEARLQAHWAAQCVAAVGATQVQARLDDSHTSLSWHDGLRALVSETTPGGYRAGLRLADQQLILVDGKQVVVEEFPVAGLELSQAIGVLSAAIERFTGSAPSPPLTPPIYEMPEHSLGQGGVFSVADGSGVSALSLWYANAARLLDAIREANECASPVRCWPHHFDIATLMALDVGGDPETSRSIGVGMSPGDSSYSEPYFYVNPWPPPKPGDLPPLGGRGIWHTKGWVGAVLPASQMDLTMNGPGQGEQVGAHLRAGLETARALLATRGS